MKLPNMILVRLGLLGLGMLAEPIMAQASGLTQSYCSTENTGNDGPSMNSIYMSMGKCFDNCKASYAFAVVQYKNCWCSNYIPSQQESTGSCNQQCPGYPGDFCGNGNNGLYGYIPLYNAPAGTAGASSSPPAPQSSSPPPQPESSSEPPATSYAPTSSYVPPSSSEPPSSSDPEPISSSSSSPPTTSSDASPSTSPTPVRTVVKTTISGSVVTQTVTQTPIVIGGGASGTTSPDNMQVQQQPLSIGAIAGIVVGTLVGLAALLVAAFVIWRRKKNQDAEHGGSSTFAGGAGATKRPRRNTSVLSKTGLLSRNRQSMSENTYDDNNFYGPGGGNSVRHSMMLGAGAAAEGVSPVSPLGSSAENVTASAGTGSGRRHSKPLVYDQRLNPSALFANADANGSRVSIQDQNDYSRPLGVANPDLRASFDSR